MNRLEVEVVQIEACGRLHAVTLRLRKSSLHVVTLELPSGIAVGKRVGVVIKPTQIHLARSRCNDLSIDNQIDATVRSVETGEILTTLMLDMEANAIEAIVTTRAARRLQLTPGADVVVLLHAATLSLAEAEDVR